MQQPSAHGPAGRLTMRRLSTGIPQLDTVLGGGLLVGSLIVVAGAPGTGKTILAQQICFNNASSEHWAVYLFDDLGTAR